MILKQHQAPPADTRNNKTSLAFDWDEGINIGLEEDEEDDEEEDNDMNNTEYNSGSLEEDLRKIINSPRTKGAPELILNKNRNNNHTNHTNTTSYESKTSTSTRVTPSSSRTNLHSQTRDRHSPHSSTSQPTTPRGSSLQHRSWGHNSFNSEKNIDSQEKELSEYFDSSISNNPSTLIQGTVIDINNENVHELERIGSGTFHTAVTPRGSPPTTAGTLKTVKVLRNLYIIVSLYTSCCNYRKNYFFSLVHFLLLIVVLCKSKFSKLNPNSVY